MTDFQAAIREASQDLGNALAAIDPDVDFGECRRCVLAFFGIEDAHGLTHVRQIQSGQFVSISSKHVLDNKGQINYLDVSTAMTAVAGAANASTPLGLALSIITGGLFFLRRARELTRITIGFQDSAALLALVRQVPDNQPTTVDVLAPAFAAAANESPVKLKGSKEELGASLSALEELGIARRDDAGRWSLCTTVELAPVRP